MQSSRERTKQNRRPIMTISTKTRSASLPGPLPGPSHVQTFEHSRARTAQKIWDQSRSFALSNSIYKQSSAKCNFEEQGRAKPATLQSGKQAQFGLAHSNLQAKRNSRNRRSFSRPPTLRKRRLSASSHLFEHLKPWHVNQTKVKALWGVSSRCEYRI